MYYLCALKASSQHTQLVNNISDIGILRIDALICMALERYTRASLVLDGYTDSPVVCILITEWIVRNEI